VSLSAQGEEYDLDTHSFLRWSAARCIKGCGFLFFMFFLSLPLSLFFFLQIAIADECGMAAV
jgi:hypothetical protein